MSKQTYNTLNETHNTIVNNFDKKYESIPKLEQKLKKYKQKLSEYETKTNFEESDIRKKSQLKDKIEDLESEIDTIKNQYDEIKYFSDTSNVIVNYYESLGDTANNDDIIEIDASTTKQPQKSKINKEDIFKDLDKLNKKHKKNKHQKTTKKRYKKEKLEKSKKNNMLKFLKPVDKVNDHAEYYDEYLSLIDNSHVKREDAKYCPRKLCESCNVDMQLIPGEGLYMCPSCNGAEYVIIESDRPNYKDPVPEKAGYPYRRINHFAECLTQFQAKETTEIPKEVMDELINELNKQKIKDWSKIKKDKIREILKSVDKNQYYEHSMHIRSKLSGLPPIVIPREVEETMKDMFREIQEPFDLYNPPTRSNFLSYSYVFHKFFQLLDMDEYAKYFTLLKNKNRLREQDAIWEKICRYLRWQYIPSI